MRSDHQVVGLYETLVKAGRPLAPEELFKQAGLKADDQPESVEIFYHELDADRREGWILVDRERNLLRASDVPAEMEEPSPTEEASTLNSLAHKPTTAKARKAQQTENLVDRPTLWPEE